MTFAEKTVKSALWTYLAFILNKSSTFITTIILTHLILPAEYGIITSAVAVISFLDAVRDLGLGLSLIQRRDEIEEASHTAFWLSVGSNAVIWLLAILVSPTVANFFNQPLLTLVLPIMCISFIINSFGSVHDALLQRDMKFRKRMVPDVWSSVIKGIVTVVLALAGWTVWALVVGQIVGRLVYTLLVWRVSTFRPRWYFNPRIARELLSFGYKLSIDSFISALQANVDYIFIGRFLGDTALGLYGVAFRVPELIIINFCIVIATVLFPAYSELEDSDKLKEAMLGAFHYISLVTIPAGIGLALISPLFVNTLYGENWSDAGIMMSLLSLYGMMLAISWNIGDVYKALGRGDILWKTSLIELILLAVVLFFMAQISAVAVSAGHFLVAITVTLIRVNIVSILLKIPRMLVLRQFIPAVIGSAFMGIGVFAILQLTVSWWQIISLASAILGGALIYTTAMWWLERSLVLQVAEVVVDRVPMLEKFVKINKS